MYWADLDVDGVEKGSNEPRAIASSVEGEFVVTSVLNVCAVFENALNILCD